jgi:hypothetical protein
MANFFSDIFENLKALKQLPGQIQQSNIAAEQANKVAEEARKKGVYNVDAPRTYNFFSDVLNASKGAKNVTEALANFTNFTESNKPYKVLPTIEAKTKIGKVAAFVPNMVSGLVNETVGEGLNVVSDTARNYVETKKGRQVPYEELKSSAWKLRQNIEGINDTPTEVIGNIAGTLNPILTVSMGGAPTKTAVGAVGNLAKKKLGKVMLEGAIGGAKAGATFGALQGLTDNRNSLKEQLTAGAMGGVTGGVGGAILGGGAAGLGYGLGEYKRAPDSVKRGGYIKVGPEDAGSFGDDAAKQAGVNTKINVKNLKISDAKKQVTVDAVEAIKPRIEKLVGKKLSNKEVASYASQTSKTLESTIGRNQTKQWNAAMLNLRERIAKSAADGKVDKQFIEDLLTVKTQGADIARKLQSLSIQASPSEKSIKTSIINAILDVNKNTDDILKAAEGVDFNDLNQATNFYRQFIKPDVSEWVDLIRYNSMLSSPNTHIINTFSNVMNTSFIAPIEKSLTGGIDYIGSKISGKERNYYAGEGWQYLKGYVSNIKNATHKFSNVMSGKSGFTNLDVSKMPVGTSKWAKTLSYPLRLLEASDQFFTELGTAAEKAALQFRQSRGVKIANIDIAAAEDAAYRVFRQDLNNVNQGQVLGAIDKVTGMVMRLRNSDNKLASTVGKFTLPFVKTPMNIFKQGIEYSPLGFATTIGAKNVEQQISKAILGTSVFVAASTMLSSDRLTWAEPANAKEKELWRKAGKQAYSIKIGDTWFSYQKLAPAIAFPFAMVAALDDLQKNKKMDDDLLDLVLGGMSKYGQFLADQSYAKSIGNLLDLAGGGPGVWSKWASNFPQQMIPFRALTGWFARLSDATQRVTDDKANFVEKQIQLLMQQYPGLSQLTPARTDSDGNPIPSRNRVVNAVSPVRTSKEDKKFAEFLNNYESFKIDSRRSDERTSAAKSDFQAKYDAIKKTYKEQGMGAAQKMIDALTDEEYATFESMYKSENSKKRNNAVIDVYPKVQEVRALMNSGKKKEAQDVVNSMSDEEYKLFESAYKQTD